MPRHALASLGLPERTMLFRTVLVLLGLAGCALAVLLVMTAVGMAQTSGHHWLQCHSNAQGQEVCRNCRQVAGFKHPRCGRLFRTEKPTD